MLKFAITKNHILETTKEENIMDLQDPRPSLKNFKPLEKEDVFNVKPKRFDVFVIHPGSECVTTAKRPTVSQVPKVKAGSVKFRDVVPYDVLQQLGKNLLWRKVNFEFTENRKVKDSEEKKSTQVNLETILLIEDPHLYRTAKHQEVTGFNLNLEFNPLATVINASDRGDDLTKVCHVYGRAYLLHVVTNKKNNVRRCATWTASDQKRLHALYVQNHRANVERRNSMRLPTRLAKYQLFTREHNSDIQDAIGSLVKSEQKKIDKKLAKDIKNLKGNFKSDEDPEYLKQVKSLTREAQRHMASFRMKYQQSTCKDMVDSLSGSALKKFEDKYEAVNQKVVEDRVEIAKTFGIPRQMPLTQAIHMFGSERDIEDHKELRSAWAKLDQEEKEAYIEKAKDMFQTINQKLHNDCVRNLVMPKDEVSFRPVYPTKRKRAD